MSDKVSKNADSKSAGGRAGTASDALLRQAIGMHGMGRLDAAQGFYLQWLKANPGEVTGTYRLAELLCQRGRPAEAVPLFRQLVKRDPSNVDAWSKLGDAYIAVRDFGSASQCLEQVIELRPSSPTAHYSLGVVLQALLRPSDALRSYERAIKLRPDYAQAHNRRGMALAALGRLDEALGSFDRAVELMPDHAETHNNRGSALSALGRLDEAQSCYERALAIKPEYPVAHFNLGMVMLELSRPADALARFEQAIALRAEYGPAHRCRGTVLASLDRLHEAIESLDRALALMPGDPEALNNRGCALARLGRADEALLDYHSALIGAPELADAHWNIGVEELRRGQLAAAWVRHEYRWKRSGAPPRRHESIPSWRGAEPVQGKRLLAWCEQGFGDTVQFCRYVPMLAALGAQVVLEVQPQLRALMGTLAGVSELHARGEPVNPCDFQVPLLTLPLAFGTDLPTIPAQVPYLSADPDRIVRWRQRLGRDTGLPRIGIACSGSTAHANDRKRSMALRHFSPLYGKTQLYLLQTDVRREDEADLRDGPVQDLSGELGDFADTAALIECLDLVISVDTAVVHVAGALGKPAWVLLSSDSDWRWMLERADSPWYPSVRLFRQPRLGDWSSVIEEVAAAIQRGT